MGKRIKTTKISRNTIITLSDNNQYLVVTGEVLEDDKFCLVSTLSQPKEYKVVEFFDGEDCSYFKQYVGSDYKYILKRLMDKAFEEANKERKMQEKKKV